VISTYLGKQLTDYLVGSYTQCEGTCPSYLLETEGLFTQGWRPGRTFGERSVGLSKWTVLIGRT
jgi:hypothetical protein